MVEMSGKSVQRVVFVKNDKVLKIMKSLIPTWPGNCLTRNVEFSAIDKTMALFWCWRFCRIRGYTPWRSGCEFDKIANYDQLPAACQLSTMFVCQRKRKLSGSGGALSPLFLVLCSVKWPPGYKGGICKVPEMDGLSAPACSLKVNQNSVNR